MNHETAIALLNQELARARRAIAMERLVPLLAPLIIAILLWAGIALLGGQNLLAPLAASLAAIGALLLFAVLIGRALHRWRRPTNHDARSRLAIDAGMEPSSFDALEDQPSKLEAGSLVLWEREQQRAREVAAKAVAQPAKLKLNKADPFRLRYISLLAIVVGVVIAGFEAPDRLNHAFVPDPGPLLGDGPMEIEAWAQPAAYTGQPSVSLTERIGKQVGTPPSVEVTVRVTGPVGAPFLKFDSGDIHRSVQFEKAADGAYEAKMMLPRAGTLRVVRFNTKARWIVTPAADKIPTATFAVMPSIKDDKVSFNWKATDDFGVQKIVLRARPINPPEGLKAAAAQDYEVDAPGGDQKAAEGVANLDLFEHPYAGMRVMLQVVAIDAMGQEGLSAPMSIKLPEQVFLQPIAQAAIEIRKQILYERRAYAPAPTLRGDQMPATLGGFDTQYGTARDIILTDEFDPKIERAPLAIREAGHKLDALTANSGQDFYFRDLSVFSGFRGARAAINNAREIIQTNEAAAILWQTALRAEYGSAADAKRALEEAQRQLSEAIQRGASQEEINRLTQAMRQAMRNYIQSMVAEAMRNGQKPQQSAEDGRDQQGGQRGITQNDLDAMLREIQRLTAEGKTEEAQRLLEQLAQMMANMEVQMGQSGQGEGQQGEQQSGQGQQGQGDPDLNQSMEGLSEAMGEQRALRDETQRQGQQGQGQQGQGQQGQGQQGQQQGQGQQGQGNGQPGSGQGGQGESGEQLAQRQGQIGRALSEARRDAQRGGMGDNSALNQALDRAESAMSRAQQALRRGDYGDARGEQDEALRQMRLGSEQLAERLRSNQAEREGQREEDQRAQNGQKDPLGRPVGGVDNNGDSITVPDNVAKEQVRDILEELRKRAQDPRRPVAEREYLQRLLERFSGT